jgi:hypothetical protein
MRTVLYANRKVSDYLRESFILLWSSERPVPRVTIDFGDGRVIERTITGNAVHYVLDAQGRPLDAIPGLYGPGAFLRAIHQGWELHSALEGFPDELRAELLRKHHQVRADVNARNLAAYRQSAARQWPSSVRAPSARPTAAEAGAIALTKSGIELSMVQSVAVPEPPDGAEWQRIARLRAGDARLDSRSLLLMSREIGEDLIDAESAERVSTYMQAMAASQAIDRASSKRGGGQRALVVRMSSSERELANLAGNFEGLLALDTVRNEYEFRVIIHKWFAAGEVGESLDELNERVYSDIFLTPRSDPWLGLGAQENYTGIAGGGRR